MERFRNKFGLSEGFTRASDSAINGDMSNQELGNNEVESSSTADRLVSEIRALPDIEKLRLVDAILTDLDTPDPEIDRIWADEARKRWAAYRAGRIPTVSYEDVMAKHRQ
jgi:putative addiction module component (TIGR02574 family)